MSALKELYDELKLLLQSGQLYAARQKLLALGFPDGLIPDQLDAARELVQRQRFVPGRRRPALAETGRMDYNCSSGDGPARARARTDKDGCR